MIYYFLKKIEIQKYFSKHRSACNVTLQATNCAVLIDTITPFTRMCAAKTVCICKRNFICTFDLCQIIHVSTYLIIEFFNASVELICCLYYVHLFLQILLNNSWSSTYSALKTIDLFLNSLIRACFCRFSQVHVSHACSFWHILCQQSLSYYHSLTVYCFVVQYLLQLIARYIVFDCKYGHDIIRENYCKG